MDTDSAFESIERDISDRLAKFTKGGRIPVRISEANPFRLTELTKLEEKAKIEPEFADYLSTWDQDLLSRVSIVDEDLDDPDSSITEVGYEDMPPREYMLRYYVREYEDDIQLPPSAIQFMPPLNESVH
jgi:hypothetical protein